MRIVVSFKLNGCKGLANEIQSLEHVQIIADIESESRGLLSIWLESPSGMRSQLLHPRAKDNSTDGFNNWAFNSVQFWGENPSGLWKLHIDQIKGASKLEDPKSTLKNVSIVFYGTNDIPSNAQSPKQYQNLTGLPKIESNFSSNEESIDITDIENTIQKARRSLRIIRFSEENEQHLIAVDRLVRRINKMNLNSERQKRFTHIHHANEK